MSVPPFSEDSLHAAAVPRTGAELVDVDALDAAQVDADRRRAVRAGPLGIAFDAAGRAEAVVQLLLVEQVVALPVRALGQLELCLGREGPDGAELGADRAVALQGLVGVDLDRVGDRTAMAASGVILGSQDVLRWARTLSSLATLGMTALP
jgi:hypothetical protein